MISISSTVDGSLFCSQTVSYPSQYEIELYQTRLINFKKEGMGRALYDGEHRNEVLVTSWKNGMKNGDGFIYDRDTKRVIRRMQFIDNEPVEESILSSVNTMTGIVDCEDGSHWEGETVDGEPCGEGCIYDADNNLIYKGTFINGGREGYGISYYPNLLPLTVSYDGLWCRDVHHGEGKIYNRRGELEVTGLFLEDELISTEVFVSRFEDINKLSTLTETITIADNSLNEIVSVDLYECRRLRSLVIGDNCCKNVKTFGLRYLRDLISVKIGKYSFTNLQAPTIPAGIRELIERENRLCEILNCPRLESISIDVGSFFEFAEVRMESSCLMIDE